MRNRECYTILMIICLILTLLPAAVSANQAPVVRVKDIARVQGVRDNQLYGLGLVIGLNGTGDSTQTQANVQMVANMLARFGITVNPEDMRLRNVAAVMVTANIGSAVRTGDRIDVTVSSIGDAKSLQGGYLLQTPLQAANGQIYAAAQGPLSIGGFVVRGGSSGGQQNHTTVAVISNGAIVEQEIPHSFMENGEIHFVLQEPDFSTAARLVDTINQVYPNTAWAMDQATIVVSVPDRYVDNVVSFVAALEELPIQPTTKARVVINERTGTVVMGADVRIATVAVSHGNLSVKVGSSTQITYTAENAADTYDISNYNWDSPEETYGSMVLLGGSNVEDLVNALNAIGASPRDIIAILEAIKAAGALYGELIIM